MSGGESDPTKPAPADDSHIESTTVDKSLEFVRNIAQAVQHAGGRALIVGGWVRDNLRGHPSKDIDLEVFGVAQPALAALLAGHGRVEAVGHSFPVYKVFTPEHGPSAIDVALPRRE